MKIDTKILNQQIVLKKRLTKFLWRAIGYCSEENYDKWFLDESTR